MMLSYGVYMLVYTYGEHQRTCKKGNKADGSKDQNMWWVFSLVQAFQDLAGSSSSMTQLKALTLGEKVSVPRAS